LKGECIVYASSLIFNAYSPGDSGDERQFAGSESFNDNTKKLTSSKSDIFEHLPLTWQNLYLHRFHASAWSQKQNGTEVAKP